MKFIIALFTAVTMPVSLAAQEQKEEKNEHHHYKLIDVGTLGGPNSLFSGPILEISKQPRDVRGNREYTRCQSQSGLQHSVQLTRLFCRACRCMARRHPD
jgi:hypothetical protein